MGGKANRVWLPRALKLNAIEGKGRTKGKTKAEEKRRGRISNGSSRRPIIAMEILRCEKKGIIILQLLRRARALKTPFNCVARAFDEINGITASLRSATNRCLSS